LWSTAIYHYHATLWFVNLVAGQPGSRPFGIRPSTLSPVALSTVALSTVALSPSHVALQIPVCGTTQDQRQPAWLGLQSVFGHRLVSNHYPMAENRSSGLPEAFLAGYE